MCKMQEDSASGNNGVLADSSAGSCAHAKELLSKSRSLGKSLGDDS